MEKQLYCDLVKVFRIDVSHHNTISIVCRYPKRQLQIFDIYNKGKGADMAKKSTRLEALHNIFEENGISPDTIELNDSLIMDIKKHAEAVPDYMHPSYTKHCDFCISLYPLYTAGKIP